MCGLWPLYIKYDLEQAFRLQILSARNLLRTGLQWSSLLRALFTAMKANCGSFFSSLSLAPRSYIAHLTTPSVHVVISRVGGKVNLPPVRSTSTLFFASLLRIGSLGVLRSAVTLW